MKPKKHIVKRIIKKTSGAMESFEPRMMLAVGTSLGEDYQKSLTDNNAWFDLKFSSDAPAKVFEDNIGKVIAEETTDLSHDKDALISIYSHVQGANALYGQFVASFKGVVVGLKAVDNSQIFGSDGKGIDITTDQVQDTGTLKEFEAFVKKDSNGGSARWSDYQDANLKTDALTVVKWQRDLLAFEKSRLEKVILQDIKVSQEKLGKLYGSTYANELVQKNFDLTKVDPVTKQITFNADALESAIKWAKDDAHAIQGALDKVTVPTGVYSVKSGAFNTFKNNIAADVSNKSLVDLATSEAYVSVVDKLHTLLLGDAVSKTPGAIDTLKNEYAKFVNEFDEGINDYDKLIKSYEEGIGDFQTMINGLKDSPFHNAFFVTSSDDGSGNISYAYNPDFLKQQNDVLKGFENSLNPIAKNLEDLTIKLKDLETKLPDDKKAIYEAAKALSDAYENFKFDPKAVRAIQTVVSAWSLDESSLNSWVQNCENAVTELETYKKSLPANKSLNDINQLEVNAKAELAMAKATQDEWAQNKQVIEGAVNQFKADAQSALDKHAGLTLKKQNFKNDELAPAAKAYGDDLLNHVRDHIDLFNSTNKGLLDNINQVENSIENNTSQLGGNLNSINGKYEQFLKDYRSQGAGYGVSNLIDNSYWLWNRVNGFSAEHISLGFDLPLPYAVTDGQKLQLKTDLAQLNALEVSINDAIKNLDTSISNLSSKNPNALLSDAFDLIEGIKKDKSAIQAIKGNFDASGYDDLIKKCDNKLKEAQTIHTTLRDALGGVDKNGVPYPSQLKVNADKQLTDLLKSVEGLKSNIEYYLKAEVKPAAKPAAKPASTGNAPSSSTKGSQYSDVHNKIHGRK